LKQPKWNSQAVNRRRADNTMAKRKKYKTCRWSVLDI